MRKTQNVPDLRGMKIDKAIEVLEDNNIKYNKDYIYKTTLFKRRGIVLKTDPEFGEKYDKKKELDIYVSRFMLLPFFIFFFLLIPVLWFNLGKSDLDYDAKNSPYIVAEKEGWVQSNIVYVSKDANIKNIEYYEYCTRQDENAKLCEWKRTDTKSTVISTTGIWNVWFRAVNNKNKHSKISNMVTVYIDNEAPEVKGDLNVTIEDDKIIINIETDDPECGLTGIYYSLDGNDYKSLINNEIPNLKPNTSYTIYIKIVDCVGNEKIIIKKIKTKAKGEEPTNPEDPTNDGQGGDGDPEVDEVKDDVIPEISLRDVPAVIKFADNYPLPSWYKFGPSGGTVECHDQNNNTLTDTSNLAIGDYTITCTATGNNGLVATTSKDITVDYQEGADEEWDGWVILNLYYPKNSTNRMWRLNSVNAVRDGLGGTDWQPYVGPIKVRIEDVGNVYIKYDLNGKEIIEQQGSPIVDIRPESFEVYNFDTTYVTIVYDEEAITREYRINNGEWKEYTEGFFVGPNTLIEARTSKELSTYNSTTGEVLSTRTVSNTDAVIIRERPWTTDSLFGKVDINIAKSPSAVNDDNMSTISIYYQSDSENRVYRINGGAYKKYEGPFEVPKNTTIEAYATAKRSVTTREGNKFEGTTDGYDRERVYDGNDYHDYGVYLSANSLLDVTEFTDVYVSTDRNLQELWYQVNGEEWISAPANSNSNYKLINVGVNTTVSVKARYLNNDNKERIAYDTITVGENKNSLRLFITTRDEILDNSTTPVTIYANYPTNYIKYRINGGDWIDYTGSFEVPNDTYVEAIAEKDNSDNTKQNKYAAKYVGTSLLQVNMGYPNYLYVDEHGSVVISSNYPTAKLYYSYDGATWNNYTTPLDVMGGTTVYAKAEYTDTKGILRTDVKSDYVRLINNLAGPHITANKTTTTTTPVKITMTTDFEGDIYYSLNGGATRRYEGPFDVSSNVHIDAYYIRKSDGLRSKGSYYRVENIRNTNKPTVNIYANPDPHTSRSLADKVKVTIKAYDYDLIEYSFDDIYYMVYYGPFEVTNNVTVYARAKNYNGYAYDQLVINNLNPIKPTNLSSEISLNPAGQNKYNSVNEVTVTLTYDDRAKEKKYKLGSTDSWHDYTGPFAITKNTTIYLYEKNDEIRGVGTNQRVVNFLPDGLIDPIIRAIPDNSKIASDVDVMIEYDSVATVKKYSINGGALQNYNGQFNISTNNTVIYAYSEDINHNVATTTYTITNIHDITTAVLDKGMYYLIHLNYPSTSKPDKREYKYGLDGEWKPYPPEGLLLIKPQYKDILVHDDVLIIKLTDDDGNEYEFKGDWYIMDDTISNILANIGMRWNTEPPAKPIIQPYTNNWVSKLDISIDYIDRMEKYLYKIVYKDGRTTGWLDYVGPFTVEENEAVVYAKAMDELEVWSEEASYRITNIDDGNPGVRYMNVVNTTTGTITVSVDGLDNESGIKYYYYSTDNEHFNVSDTKQFTYSGLNSDTVYTLYVYTQDAVGNNSEVYHIDAKTNTMAQPQVRFEPDLETWSGYKKVYLSHEDPLMKLYYSFDNGNTWNEYDTPITMEHNGTIMAKASDDVNVSQSPNYDVNTIDDTKPIVTKVIYAPRSSRLIINAEAEDHETDIKHYLYSIDGEHYTQSTNEYSFTNLKSNYNYTIYVKAVNKANVESDPYTIEAVTNDINDITYEVSDPEQWTYTKTVTINYPKEIDNDYIKEYSINGGSTWVTYKNPVLIESEDVSIIARVRDGSQNTKMASTLLITKIDRTIPSIDLSGLPDEFDVYEDYPIPTSYTVNNNKSGGTIECTSSLGGTHTSTKTLPAGGQSIECTVTTGAGKTAAAMKNVRAIKIDERTGESILKILEDDTLESQYYNFIVQKDDENIVYPVHLYVLDGDQTITENTQYGDMFDVASGTAASQMAKNMVIVKVKGNLTINEGVTVGPYYNARYGGPKGFALYVTGKLTNNGTIDNSHGAYAVGENIYLWKNSETANYEYVPAAGGAGGASNSAAGGAGTGRALGGGGAGGGGNNAGKGSAATSYSGGTGGSGVYMGHPGYAASGNGGAGGGNTSSTGAGGAGNPGAPGGNVNNQGQISGGNGTGGLLIIYSNEYVNNGTITARGTAGGAARSGGAGGSSGGGSINIFTNQPTNINAIGVNTDERFNSIKGTTTYSGGSVSGSGAGGAGSVNIGEIRNGQYYDLKQIIEQDKESYIENHTKTGDGILPLLNDDSLTTGYYFFNVNGENYPIHLYVLDGDQVFDTNKVFGDANDISKNIAATSTTSAYRSYAQNMVVVKVKGNLTINSGVTVSPYSTSLGGPKGFTLYVTGKLTNNGIIDNSHGAYAIGQNVYMWKNADDSYEYVPATGGAGGASNQAAGGAGTGRALGGGGAGGGGNNAGKGSAATSYSGGTGGSGVYMGHPGYAAASNGGAGGGNSSSTGAGGAGNPGAAGGNVNNQPQNAGGSGTGGLLIIYSNEYVNNGTISARGTAGGAARSGGAGGSSGGGSINIFTNQPTNINAIGVNTDERFNSIKGATNYSGGSVSGSGAGGAGSVNIGEIRNGQYYDLKQIIEQDKELYIQQQTKYGDSILSLLSDDSLHSGYYFFNVNDEKYPIHLYVLDGDQTFTENQVFGDENDISKNVAATSTTAAYRDYAQNMVVVKVKGDLTINSGVTVSPYSTSLGGPKGFMLYITGDLTNNGIIDNSHGAYAIGQNVYLWKNADDTYEYIPATGSTGGTSNGAAGKAATGRALAGGGAGYGGTNAGHGGTATSYSGGTGGSGVYSGWPGYAGSPNGGQGGGNSSSTGAGGAGNPGAPGGNVNNQRQRAGQNGTGGLLMIYSNNYINNGTVRANGAAGGAGLNGGSGGCSGGGSINIFYVSELAKGNALANGGTVSLGGTGGKGTITYTQIENLSYKDNNSTDSNLGNTRVINPTITISTPDMSDSKSISISYPDGYTNEYSIDLGNTWLPYTESITITQPTTIIARTVDGGGKVMSSSSFTIDKIDNETPTIELNLNDVISVGDDISLPTGYTSTKSGVTYECKIGDNVITNTKDLAVGEYDITCTIINGLNKSSNATKHIIVKEVESGE